MDCASSPRHRSNPRRDAATDSPLPSASRTPRVACMRAWCWVFLCTLLGAGAATSSSAQEASSAARPADAQREARRLFEHGVQLSQRGDWLASAEAFRASAAIVQRPGTLFNLSVMYERAGQLEGAWRAANRYLAVSDPERHARQRTEAQEIRRRARAGLARLRIVVEPGAAKVELDGRPRDLLSGAGDFMLAPGAHRVDVVADGFEPTTLRLDLRPGSDVSQRIGLRKAVSPTTPLPAPTPALRQPARRAVLPAPKRPRRRWAKWVLAASGAFVAAGVVAGGLAIRDTRRVEQLDTGTSWGDIEDAHRRAPRWWAASGTLVGLGLLGGATAWAGSRFDRDGASTAPRESADAR